MNAEQQLKEWDQIVANAWQDDSLKRRLLSNPASVLTEYGLEVPAGVQVRVVENTDRLVHLTIPAKPQERELSDDDMEKVAGGRLDPMLVGTLSVVFGWNSDQIGKIFAADGDKAEPPVRQGGGNDRSPPGPA